MSTQDYVNGWNAQVNGDKLVATQSSRSFKNGYNDAKLSQEAGNDPKERRYTRFHWFDRTEEGQIVHTERYPNGYVSHWILWEGSMLEIADGDLING